MVQTTLFQQLRPTCTRLCQLAAEDSSRPAAWPQLQEALGSLSGILTETKRLEEPLSDYVLFPLLQVFRQKSNSQPPSVRAAALRCLGSIIEKSPDRLARADFALQILILFVNLFERQSHLMLQRAADEHELMALCMCLRHLCAPGQLHYPKGTESATASSTAIFGTLLAVLLEIAGSEDVSAARISALQAIEALLRTENDPNILRQYLPGLLSNLVKPFVNQAGSRWPSKALAISLDIIGCVLGRSLGLAPGVNAEPSSRERDERHSWLRLNSKNIVAAFRHLTKARTHTREEVRDSLFEVCLVTLSICSSAQVGDLAELLLHTLVELQGNRSLDIRFGRLVKTITSSQMLHDDFRRTYNAIIGRLPSETHSPDQQRHELAFYSANGCLQVAVEIGESAHELSQLLVDALFAVASMLCQQANSISITRTGPHLLADTGDHDSSARITDVLGPDLRLQNDIELVRRLLRAALASSFGAELLSLMVASAELRSNLTAVTIPRMLMLAACLEEVSELEGRSAKNEAVVTPVENIVSMGYSISLEILKHGAGEHEEKWQAKVLALNFVEQRAVRECSGFKPELVYALYPVVEHVASRSSVVHNHASRTLKSISKACGYASTAELMIENSDYIINALSIRMNTFDIRPEAADVLQVAVQLCGVQFLPHLHELTESLFSILDMYHGYPALVQSLFEVLNIILDQAGSAVPSANHSMLEAAQPSLSESELMLRIRVFNASTSAQNVDSAMAALDQVDKPGGIEQPENQITETVMTASRNPTSKTLATRVLRHAQYFLTYRTSTVRHELLQIVQKGFRVLREDEDDLLPIISDLWPVLVLRLHDDESYVIVETLQTLRTAITCAGDFLTSRFEDAWPALKSFIVHYRPSGPANALKVWDQQTRLTPAGNVWQGLLHFMETLILSIRVKPEMEDDIFAILGNHPCLSPDLEHALMRLNSDSLWLSRTLNRAEPRVARQKLAYEQPYGWFQT